MTRPTLTVTRAATIPFFNQFTCIDDAVLATPPGHRELYYDGAWQIAQGAVGRTINPGKGADLGEVAEALPHSLRRSKAMSSLAAARRRLCMVAKSRTSRAW